MKAAIRASAMHDVGVRLDDMLESTKSTIVRGEGRVDGAMAAAKACARIAELLVQEAKDQDVPPETVDLARRWVLRCAGACESIAKTAGNEVIESRGAMAGISKTVVVVKALHDLAIGEVSRVAEIAAEEDRPEEQAPKSKRRKAPIRLRRAAESSHAADA